MGVGDVRLCGVCNRTGYRGHGAPPCHPARYGRSPHYHWCWGSNYNHCGADGCASVAARPGGRLQGASDLFSSKGKGGGVMSVQLNKLFSRRQIGLWIFLGVALVIVILLAVFISPWASSSPDGLEKVAEEKGFSNKTETDKPAWEHSPMKDYAIPGIKSENTSTGIVGLIGVVITLGLMLAVAMLAVGLGRLKRRKATVTPPDET